MKVMVTGAGGFIGGYLVRRLLAEGEEVVAVDIKPKEDWWQWHVDAHNYECFDVGNMPHMLPVLLETVGDVYHLAENMGGIGFIETHRVDCLSSVTTSVALLNALQPGQHRIFFSSSACAYSQVFQSQANAALLTPLKENMAWPALPEEGYGLQKLYVEKLCQWHREERGLSVRVARFHNSYGPHGSWNDGREKAPAALCRKVATAIITGNREIEVWGTGEQLRSFMFITDNIRGIDHIMSSGYPDPVNLGSSELVTVDELVDIIEQVSEITQLKRVYNFGAAQGVMGRSSDNKLLRRVTGGWEPDISLVDGITSLYPWIYDQVKKALHE